MTSLDKILAFSHISKYLKKRDTAYVKGKLCLTDIDLKRIDGKDIEEQFLLTSFFREHIKAIIPFAEELPKLTKTATPDVLILFKNGKKILIEIKLTSNPIKRISISRINKQIEFAKMLGAPLYYLICFENRWNLFTSKFMVARNGKVNVKKDIRYSKFDQIFLVNCVAVKQGIEIEIVRHRRMRHKAGNKDPKLGVIKSITLKYLDHIYNVDITRSGDVPMFISCIVAFIDKRIINSVSEMETKEVYKFDDHLIIYDYMILLYIVYNTLNRSNNLRATASSYLTNLIEKGFEKENRISLETFIMRPITILNNNGIPFFGVKLYD